MVNKPSGKVTLENLAHFLNVRLLMCFVPASTIWLIMFVNIFIFYRLSFFLSFFFAVYGISL